MTITTIHKPDDGSTENVHQLTQKDLTTRRVDFVDIAQDPVDEKDYSMEKDPKVFKSTKTGRGPLVGDWKVGLWIGCFFLSFAREQGRTLLSNAPTPHGGGGVRRLQRVGGYLGRGEGPTLIYADATVSRIPINASRRSV